MSQQNDLLKILEESPTIQQILARAPSLELPNWYLGAGIIAQTVWNKRHGFDLNTGIKDADLIYFDTDTSYKKEDAFIAAGAKTFSDISIPVEIRNQARVHLWYREHFGYNIEPYMSSEDAIDTWPTTATSVGIRLDNPGGLCVYAPFGVDDLMSMTVRANKRQVTEEIYLHKTNRWREVWPNLKIISWNEQVG